MTTNKLNDSTSPFDALKVCDGNVEYWPARELMPLMGYQQWGDFCDAIDRATESTRKGSEIGRASCRERVCMLV